MKEIDNNVIPDIKKRKSMIPFLNYLKKQNEALKSPSARLLSEKSAVLKNASPGSLSKRNYLFNYTSYYMSSLSSKNSETSNKKNAISNFYNASPSELGLGLYFFREMHGNYLGAGEKILENNANILQRDGVNPSNAQKLRKASKLLGRIGHVGNIIKIVFSDDRDKAIAEVSGSILGGAIGQALIPIPVVGALVGSFIGEKLFSYLYTKHKENTVKSSKGTNNSTGKISHYKTFGASPSIRNANPLDELLSRHLTGFPVSYGNSSSRTGHNKTFNASPNNLNANPIVDLWGKMGGIVKVQHNSNTHRNSSGRGGIYSINKGLPKRPEEVLSKPSLVNEIMYPTLDDIPKNSNSYIPSNNQNVKQNISLNVSVNSQADGSGLAEEITQTIIARIGRVLQNSIIPGRQMPA